MPGLCIQYAMIMSGVFTKYSYCPTALSNYVLSASLISLVFLSVSSRLSFVFSVVAMSMQLRPDFKWSHDGIPYYNISEIVSASTSAQQAAIAAGHIKIGTTVPLEPRFCTRIGNRDALKTDFRDVVVEFIEFAQKFAETRDSISLQSTIRKMIHLSDALYGHNHIRPEPKAGGVASDDEARELILFAVRVHDDQGLMRRVERESGPFLSQHTLTLFRDLASIAADWWAQDIDPRVEFCRIFWAWGFPVTPRYLWLPLVDESDPSKIAFHFDKTVMSTIQLNI